jgi:beta-lactamase regulating signal transducer with metallopeptidase domain/protocatechuate 3,4-dioxygenase beta subunit
MNIWGTIISPLAGILLDASIKSAVVLLAATGVSMVMRRVSAAARHLVWSIAVAAVILLPALSLALPQWQIAVLPASSPAELHGKSAAVFEMIPRQGVQYDSASVRDPSDHSSAAEARIVQGEASTTAANPILLPVARDSARSVAITSMPLAPSRSSSHFNSLQIWIITAVSVWLGGAVVIGGTWVLAALAVRRSGRCAAPSLTGELKTIMDRLSRELGILRRVGLLLSNAQTMPITWGVIAPRILLPRSAESWPADRARSVLLHELAHVRRWDCATQFLGQMACALYWFNPLAWLAAQQLRAQRERACDDVVLNHGAPAENYAEQLVLVARSLRSARLTNVAAVAMARPSQLRGRVVAILDGSINRRGVSRRLMLSAILIAILALLPFSAIHLGVRQSQTEAAAVSTPTTRPTNTPVAGSATTQAGGMLDVLVVDAITRAPITHFSARARSGSENQIALVSGDGHIRVKIPDPKTFFLVEILADGYVGKRLEWLSPEAEPVPSTYTASLDKGGKISGRVVDDGGQPVAGAHVVVWAFAPQTLPHESVRSQQTVLCGADGAWSCANIPSECKSVEVGAWDHRYANGNSYDMPETSIDKLQDGQFKLTLARGLPIEGTVLGVDGKPLADAVVLPGADRMVSNKIPSQHTDAAGHFKFAAKPGEKVVLTFSSDHSANELREFIMPDKKYELTIQLPPPNKLSGRVVDAQGKPIGGAAVYTDTWRGNRSLTAVFNADADGRFTWDLAPTDTIYCNISAPGFLSVQGVLFQIDHANIATLHPAVHVIGTVVDEQTNQPIAAFTIVPGIASGPGRQPNWDKMNTRRGSEGKIDFREDWSYTGYAVRIEADGYIPADSRVFTSDEPEVKLEFKLTHGKEIAATIVTPAGKPVAGATALLATPGQGGYIKNGRTFIEQFCPHTTSDDKGNIHFPQTNPPFLIEIFSDDGYASVDADALAKSNQIKLEPWGKITGKLIIGGKPAGAQTISVNPAQGRTAYDRSKPQVENDVQTTTAADGTFTFDRVHGGKMSVSRSISHAMGQGMSTTSFAQTESVEVQPGKTVDVTLGGKGRPIVGKVIIPESLAGKQDWYFDSCYAEGKQLIPVTLPDSIKNGTLEQRRNWLNEFMKTDAGKAFLKAQQAVPICPLEIARDGTFRIDDVPAGDYTIIIGIERIAPAPVGTNMIARGAAKITMPTIPGGRNDQPLSIPDVQLKMADPTGNVNP